MADLYDRLTAIPESGIVKIPVHTFFTALNEWARGAVTRTQVVNAFNLDAGQQTQIDTLSSNYTAKPNAAAKVDYLMKMHDAGLLSEAGFYTKTKFNTEVGL
jgi:hypothetical protein